MRFGSRRVSKYDEWLKKSVVTWTNSWNAPPARAGVMGFIGARASAALPGFCRFKS